ncbi:hypothetical protein N8H69_20015 [Achromobacter spanius]|jgi:uncharacterized protein YutE (UPF0331/DUF86 family)|uniref:hypothetical protein n=1 Tax=Achromobacter spanius TaxID=217203 RepID=UPI002226ADA8|nr:hypothetical protein [Achromobacter spanius]MCW3154840.1 hypothetical protein [Achromobacter spanius]
MQDQVLARIDELISQGQHIVRSYGRDDYWASDVVLAQAWMASAANAILQIAPPRSFYHAEIDRLVAHEQLKGGIPNKVLEKVLGVLQSVHAEAQAGLLAKLEYQIFATAFDDFLDHASSFHKSGKVREAAILVSAVLEDTVKRIAEKNGVDSAGVSLEPLVDRLTEAEVLTVIKSKRIKSYAGVRNSALHAEWDKLDLKDVGQAINGVRELLDDYL